MNEGYLRTVVGAALEDLVHVRQAHGAGSAAYQRQLAASLGFIQGSLEEVLTAARRDLHHRQRSIKRKHRITLELPPELIELCEADGVAPQTVLRGFIADLTGIMNWASHPRADGYSSNGSDEREMAAAYYERVGYPYGKRDPR